MAGYIRKIEPFDDAVDTWTAYTKLVVKYFEVNDITGGKRVPALFSLMGGNICVTTKSYNSGQTQGQQF
jgi:hypothetical protein